jgi:hypothetical protein
VASPFPIGAKFLQMDQPPGIDQIIGGLWQPALIHITGFNLNERFVLAVDRVKNASADARGNRSE